MSTASYQLADTATMLRRNLRHAQRYPGLSLGALGMPVIMLLLFGLVFGDTFSAGLGGSSGFDYIDFLTPGILLMSIASGTMSPAPPRQPAAPHAPGCAADLGCSPACS